MPFDLMLGSMGSLQAPMIFLTQSVHEKNYNLTFPEECLLIQNEC